MSTTAQQGRFTLVLPPGWSRIPLGTGSRPAVRAVVDRAVAGLDDRRAVDVRRRLQQLLSEQVQAAQAQSGVELYLPTEQVHGISVPASVVVSLPPVGADADPMDLLLAVAAKRRGAQVVDVGGKPAVRTEDRQESAPLGEIFAETHAAARQIVHFLADPDDRSRYAVVSGTVLESTAEGGAAVADAVTELVDALVSTFRWVD
ncbi:hypothetical protein M3148_00735 [Georgenia satyanarayanai]|uniref:hypothetical protein n=1 Tax=Georgenia satyanarayanai TaxID=860221 RepID=UPI00203B2CC5|nr:hypothetical protein [Georgenia satyanarayanai]MCM3659528.1 hypothetical protein [Georgenia satyanarayanai]